MKKGTELLKIAALTLVCIALIPIGSGYLAKQTEAADKEVEHKILRTVEVAILNDEIYQEVVSFSSEENQNHQNERMKGVTITFQSVPGEKHMSAKVEEAVINRDISEKEFTIRHDMPTFYNYLQQNIGDVVEFKSEKYKHQDLIVYINLGADNNKNDVKVDIGTK